MMRILKKTVKVILIIIGLLALAVFIQSFYRRDIELPKDCDRSDWMKNISDDTLISDITIPGTHDSAALYHFLGVTGQCQGMTVEEQITAGVRFLDVRLYAKDGVLRLCHGFIDEREDFPGLLDTLYAFLDEHPSETVLMSVKKEAKAKGDNPLSFPEMFEDCVAAAPEYWFTGDRIPTLGEVRGKIVVIRRYDSSKDYGISALSGWADNSCSSLVRDDYRIEVQDYYKVESLDRKQQLVSDYLSYASAEEGDPPVLYLNFTSGYMIDTKINATFCRAVSVSDDMNPYLKKIFSGCSGGHYGVLIMDYVDAELVGEVIALNE